MVAPEFQWAGLGTALQARLQEYAIRRNVRGFIFENLPRNNSMLRLAAHAQGAITTSRDDDIVHVTVLFSHSGSKPINVAGFSRSTGQRSCSLRIVDPL